MLDKRLTEALDPLVRLDAVLRVAPFVNTLSLGFHYVLAHGDRPPAPGRVGFMDWNGEADFREYLSGVFIFYGPKNVASKLKSLSGIPGFFDSLAVTHYQQRQVFLRRNSTTEALVVACDGRLGEKFAAESMARGIRFMVYTDIVDQARELMSRSLMPENGLADRVRCLGPEISAADPSHNTPLFVYGAPCVAYMSRAHDTFVALDVDESLIASASEYETHVIWHIPEAKAHLNAEVRTALSTYHQTLFGAPGSVMDGEFGGMSKSCGDILAARHPSFQTEILASPSEFRTCLQYHHSEPITAVA